MNRKKAAVLMTFVLITQSVVGALAGEVPDSTLQTMEESIDVSTSEYASGAEETGELEFLPETTGEGEDDFALIDEIVEEESEILPEDFYADDLLSDEDEIIETDLSEEMIPDEDSELMGDDSIAELIEEEAPVIASDDDDDDDDTDHDENFRYTVDYGASITLELPSELSSGGSDFRWRKLVIEPYIEDGNLYEGPDTVLTGETSPQLQLSQVREAAVYNLSWRSSDDEYMTRTFYVGVNNGFKTYSPDADRNFSLDPGETFTLRINAKADDMTDMRFVWFSSVNYQDYQLLDGTDGNYTLTAPDNWTQYVCYVIDKYHNWAMYYFFASVENLIHIGPQTNYVAVSPNETYTMDPSVKTVDSWCMSGGSITKHWRMLRQLPILRLRFQTRTCTFAE